MLVKVYLKWLTKQIFRVVYKVKQLNETARIKHIYIVQCGDGLPNWWNIYQDGCNWPVKTHWNLGSAYQHMVELTA